MLRDSYLQSALPDRHTVLGVTLRPFAIGHQLLLERIRSPFAKAGSMLDANDADLFTALLLCSLRYEEAAELLNDPALPQIMASFCRQVTRGATRPAHWWQRRKAVNMADKWAAFALYVEQGRAVPEYDWKLDPNSEVVTIGSHPLHVVKIRLMSKLGFSETEALNCPYSLAYWNYLTHCELENKVSFIDRKAIAVNQEMAKAFDEHCRAGKRPQDFKAEEWAQN